MVKLVLATGLQELPDLTMGPFLLVPSSWWREARKLLFERVNSKSRGIQHILWPGPVVQGALGFPLKKDQPPKGIPFSSRTTRQLGGSLWLMGLPNPKSATHRPEFLSK